MHPEMQLLIRDLPPTEVAYLVIPVMEISDLGREVKMRLAGQGELVNHLLMAA